MEAAGNLDKLIQKEVAFATTCKLDLPPAYDDIAHLHVAVPVNTEVKEKEESNA